jgi:hypothetical protein
VEGGLEEPRRKRESVEKEGRTIGEPQEARGRRRGNHGNGSGNEAAAAGKSSVGRPKQEREKREART